MFGLIGAAIGGICSFVGGVCGAIGGVISSVTTGLVALGKVVADPIMNIINIISTVLGVKPAKEDPAELGLRAKKSDKTPDDFGSNEEYIAHLRNDIQIDKEDLNNLSEREHFECAALGSGIYAGALSERYDMVMDLPVWKAAAKAVESGAMTEGQVKETLDGMKERGVKDAGSFSNYMEGKANMEEQMAVYDSLKEALRKEFPDLSDADLNTKVANIEDAMKQDKQ